jgi:4'-phosphopantetheinyl transferase
MTDRARDQQADAPAPRAAAPGTVDEIAVHWATIDVDEATLARAEQLVDPATLARAGRMRRPDDRRRILLAHAVLRLALQPATGLAPADIPIQRRCAGCGATDHGRPFLPGGPSFGLSHGGSVVVVAIGPAARSVAVDVEAVQPPRRWEAVRRGAFTDRDWADTAADPGPDRTTLWARKEAAVKATGLGLAIGLTRVELAPAGQAFSPVRFAPGEPQAPSGPWAVADLELDEGHRAAVAARGTPGELRLVPPRRSTLTA